jgi:predicted PurR-regulated permease PerM
MIQRFRAVSLAALKGTLVIGAIQGALGGVAFAVAGIDGSALWGTLMAVVSALPGIGAPLVWIPVVAYLGITGRVLAAVLLTLWCAIVVGLVDNFLRPSLVGKDAQMSDLLILISTLGGIALFGAIGFLVGPIVAALFVTLWELYGKAFEDVLPEVKLRGDAPGRSE